MESSENVEEHQLASNAGLSKDDVIDANLSKDKNSEHELLEQVWDLLDNSDEDSTYGWHTYTHNWCITQSWWKLLSGDRHNAKDDDVDEVDVIDADKEAEKEARNRKRAQLLEFLSQK